MINRTNPTLSILSPSSSALLPIGLGLIFYLSLALKAPNGQSLGNGTFVRPIDQGIFPSRPTTWPTPYFSPLLVGTITSTLM